MSTYGVSAAREVPMYEGMPDTVWYHFLHGNVPGHEIDFIYQPSIPQGALTQQHFSHLARIVKYIEPRHGSAYAFAIANLSRDDTQYEPGRGGIALVLGLRIKGATDHAGRQDPPFCHSIVCVDRHLDAAAVHAAATAFHHKLLPDYASPTEATAWYHSYVAAAQQRPESLLDVIREYIQNFNDLPTPGPSGLALRWTVENSTPPKRIVVVYPDETPFDALAHCGARIASVLVESDIRWSAISNGREQDVMGGTSVRFVPEREASQEPSGVMVMQLDQVPTEPRDIAGQLFGAEEVRVSQMSNLRTNWRDMMANQGRVNSVTAMPSALSIATAIAEGERGERARPWAKPSAEVSAEPSVTEAPERAEPAPMSTKAAAEPSSTTSSSSEPKQNQRRSMMPIVGLGVFIAVVGLGAALWFGLSSAPTNGSATGQASTTAAPQQAPVPPLTTAPTASEAPVPQPLTVPTESTAPETSVDESASNTEKPATKKKTKTKTTTKKPDPTKEPDTTKTADPPKGTDPPKEAPTTPKVDPPKPPGGDSLFDLTPKKK